MMNWKILRSAPADAKAMADRLDDNLSSAIIQHVVISQIRVISGENLFGLRVKIRPGVSHGIQYA